MLLVLLTCDRVWDLEFRGSSVVELAATAQSHTQVLIHLLVTKLHQNKPLRNHLFLFTLFAILNLKFFPNLIQKSHVMLKPQAQKISPLAWFANPTSTSSSVLFQFPLVKPILSTMAKKGNHFSPRPRIPLQMNTNHFQQPSPAQSPCASSPWLWQDTTRPSYDRAHTDLWACWNTIPSVRRNTLICQFWPGALREKIRGLMGRQNNFWKRILQRALVASLTAQCAL